MEGGGGAKVTLLFVNSSLFSFSAFFIDAFDRIVFVAVDNAGARRGAGSIGFG